MHTLECVVSFVEVDHRASLRLFNRSAEVQHDCPVNSFFPGEQRRCLEEVATRSAADGGCRGVAVVVVGWAVGDHQRKGVGVRGDACSYFSR